MMRIVRQIFWMIRYRLYNRDLYRPLREGRGTKDNPLTIDDLRPLRTALRRIGGEPD